MDHIRKSDSDRNIFCNVGHTYPRREEEIELFGERLLAVKEELAERDISEVPTPRLFDMLMTFLAALEKEAVRPVFTTAEEP